MHESKVLKIAVLDFIARSEDGVFASIISSSEWIKFAGQNEDWASKITEEVFKKVNFKN
jgi:hypothetical protein